MLYVLIGLIILASLLLWVVILIQNPKGGGLSSQMGGSSVTNIIGAKQSADVVEKATWIIIGVIFALVVFSSYVTSPGDGVIDSGLDATQVQSAPDPSSTTPPANQGNTEFFPPDGDSTK